MRVRKVVFALLFSLVAVACSDNSSDEGTAGGSTDEAPSTTQNNTSSTLDDDSDDDASDLDSCPDAAPIPASAAELSEATVNFDGDGDGENDRLATYKDGDNWWVGVEWSNGGSSRAIIDEAFMGAAAAGGYDLDGDGNDEAFVSIYGPASGVMVGVFYRDGCDLAPVLDEDASAPFVFPVTGSIGFFSGASCNSIGDISLISGELLDEEAGEYEVSEVPYSFDSTSGTLSSGFGDGGSVTFDEIGDLSQLDCGDLANAL